MKTQKLTLNAIINTLAHKKGYPHQKLSYIAYTEVLREAHKIKYNS